MTKTELQTALATATNTDKRTAGVFLDTLCSLAYKEIKKTSEFILPGSGKLVQHKRKARTRLQSQDATKDQDSLKDRCEVAGREGAKDAVLGVKK